MQSLLANLMLVLSLSLVPVLAAVAQELPDRGEGTPPPAIDQSLPHTYGIVAQRTQWHVHLVDGRTVDLTKSTQILPTGATVAAGDRIGIFGLYSRPMVLRAASITIVSDGSSGVQAVK